MNDNPRGYAWEKLSQAIVSLTADGPLAARLHDAVPQLSLLANTTGNIPEHAMPLFTSIRERCDNLDSLDISSMESIGKDLLELLAICLES